jgi:hypothetical protein
MISILRFPKHICEYSTTLSRQRALFLLSLLVVVFLAVRLTIRPINTLDYDIHIAGLQAFWEERSPYTVTGYYDPPWSIFILAPLAYQPLETWLALSIAFFTVLIFDLGKPIGVLQMAHPVFFTLLVSSNPELIFVAPGFWLLYGTPRGWGRGLAWVFLACKPQTTFLLLIFDGLCALCERDWRAVLLAPTIGLGTWALYPEYWAQFSQRLTIEWSATVMFHYGIVGALLVTGVILALRYHGWRDYKTLGILLAPVWSPYLLQYGYVGVLFTMRGAHWGAQLIYTVVGIGLVALFWREYHVAEHIATLGFVLLAAALAPVYEQAQKKERADG